VVVRRDSAGRPGVPRTVFEACSTVTPVGGTIFYPPLKADRNASIRQSGRLPDARENRGLDRRARTRVCARSRPPHSHRHPFRDNDAPGLALLSAPNTTGRSRLRYASRKRPCSGPGIPHIVLCRIIVKWLLPPSLRGGSRSNPGHYLPGCWIASPSLRSGRNDAKVSLSA
jgi:hypothetical protein